MNFHFFIISLPKGAYLVEIGPVISGADEEKFTERLFQSEMLLPTTSC